MHYLNDFKQELSDSFMMCTNVIKNYPEKIRDYAIKYFNKYNLFFANSKKNYICYCIPFWLKEITKNEMDTCIKISAGNIFAMLYFFIQDDIIDLNKVSKYDIPLSMIYFNDFLSIYKSLNINLNNFFDSYIKHTEQWVIGVLNENENVNDLSILFLKSAPLKLSISTMCAMSNKTHLINKLFDATDILLMTIQLIDDFSDFKEDIENKNNSFLINQIKFNLGIDVLESKKTDFYFNVLFESNIIENVLSIIESNDVKLKTEYQDLKYFVDFHEDLLNKFKLIINELKNDKE